MNLRLAFRVEGNMWNCYMARIDSMKNARLIGSIVMGAVEQHPEIKDSFMALMQQTFEKAAKAIAGVEIDYWNEPRPAPESERGGNA